MALLQQQPKGEWFFIDFDEDGTIYELEVEVVGADGLTPTQSRSLQLLRAIVVRLERYLKGALLSNSLSYEHMDKCMAYC